MSGWQLLAAALAEDRSAVAVDAMLLALREIKRPGAAQQEGRNAELALINALFAHGVEIGPDGSAAQRKDVTR